MDPLHAYTLLQGACKKLDACGENAIAAHVSYAMALVSGRYGVGNDYLFANDDK